MTASPPNSSPEAGTTLQLKLGEHPDCQHLEQCSELAASQHAQLANGHYDWPASILRVEDYDVWFAEHRDLRRKVRRSERDGYTFRRYDRSQHVEDTRRINTSTPARQGKPMSAGYLGEPNCGQLPEYDCERHRIDSYGVFYDRTLVAYLLLYTLGDVASISEILGHADHLNAGIMYALVAGTIHAALERSGPLHLFYNLHSSGTPGLQYHKTQLGFQPERIQWLP